MFILLRLLFILIIFMSLAFTTSLYEEEPNNTPIEATSFTGEISLNARIKKGDQDAFMWKISPKTSQYSWNMELIGAPNAMTRIDIMKIVFTKDKKEVEDYKKIFSFGTRTGAKPVNLRNLLLKSGEYLIAVTSNSSIVKSYKINITKGKKIDSVIKNNKKEPKSLSLDSFEYYTSKDKEGWLYFDVDEDDSKKILKIKASISIAEAASLELFNKDNKKIAEGKSNKFGKIKITDLELEKGKYFIKYSGSKKSLQLGIKIYSIGGQKVSKNEIEPNNDIGIANYIDYKKVTHGERNDNDGADYFIFKLPNKFKDKVFDIKLISDSKDLSISLLDEDQNKLLKRDIKSNYSMNSLMLDTQNNYFIKVEEGKTGEKYSIKFSDPRNLSKNQEIEPNDSRKNAYKIDINKEIKGNLDSNEYDCFKFSIEESGKIWNIRASMNKGRLILYNNDANIIETSSINTGKLMIKNLFLLQGDYFVCLTADIESQSYSLKINEFSLKELNINSYDDIEHEPNKNRNTSNLLQFNKEIKGILENNDDGDYFHFTLLNKEHIKITAIPPKDGDSRIKLISDSEVTMIRAYPETGKPSVIEGVFPAGRYIIDLWTEKPSYNFYSLKLERLNPFTSTKLKEKKSVFLSLKTKIENSEFTTYSDYGQVINFSIKVKNLSNKKQKYNIDTHISNNSWKTDGPKTVNLKAKGNKTLYFKLITPKNLDKTEIITTLKFANKEGEFKTTSLKVKARNNANVLNPYINWGVPYSLLGGLNVARVDFGAKRIISNKETQKGLIPEVGYDLYRLFDDEVSDRGLDLYSGRELEDFYIKIKLLGKKPLEIIGISLTPYAYSRKTLKEFYISVSQDGKTYKEIYKGKLTKGKEQFFSFDKPYLAKYAKLTLHSNQVDETKENISLGEWKVIAKQETLKLEKAFNIASYKLGGHVVKSNKELGSYWGREILTKEKDVSSGMFYKTDKNFYWVIAFRNERIAKVTSMKWIEPKRKDISIDNLKIFISTQTPNGPWKEIKEWNKKNNNLYNFDKPTWVRYIKFVGEIKEDGYYRVPEELQIFEKKPDKNYQSILGEWGDRNYKSFYEYKQSESNKKLNIITGNETRKKALKLNFNKEIKGKVSVINHEKDWYKITIPKKNNQLKLIFKSQTNIDVDYQLFDMKNNLIKPVKEIKEPLTHVFIFDVDKKNYYLKVKQPPISVIFAWDNSGSVSGFHNQIFKGVDNYIKEIQSGIDAVNLICFNDEDKFILSDFSDEPDNIREIFNNFDRNCEDSDAERPLKKSSLKLKNRVGTKGVIIIGDAIGGNDTGLWDVLKEVKPKVFSIRVQTDYKDNYLYEGIMQSWSRVNNGEYAVVNNGKELYKAINQATSILRRPVYYNLEIKSSYKKPLKNGSLKILNKKVKINNNFAIELILDASGSMLKKIKGKKRIAIARDVLKKAVTDIIPEKTQVAFRVFGHKKKGSCQTDLEIALTPLNAQKMNKVIETIEAKNLAKTPIAASLAQISSDLEKVNGKKVIILVTDGKETCKGNPAKEIKNLKAKGIDIRLNIVGFAINDKKLKKQFASWAKTGNGEYFNAKDENSLENAIKKALQIPYKIYDKNNKLVAKGIVGEKTSIKPGIYKVIIEISPEKIFKNIEIKENKSRTINLED